jgi:hypothetical protein
MLAGRRKLGGGLAADRPPRCLLSRPCTHHVLLLCLGRVQLGRALGDKSRLPEDGAARRSLPRAARDGRASGQRLWRVSELRADISFEPSRPGARNLLSDGARMLTLVLKKCFFHFASPYFSFMGEITFLPCFFIAQQIEELARKRGQQIIGIYAANESDQDGHDLTLWPKIVAEKVGEQLGDSMLPTVFMVRARDFFMSHDATIRKYSRECKFTNPFLLSQIRNDRLAENEMALKARRRRISLSVF